MTIDGRIMSTDRVARRGAEDLAVGALVVAAFVTGLFAGVHPTGTPVVDQLYGGAFGALVTLAASRARRETWLVLAVAAAALSRSWDVVPGFVGLCIAVFAALDRSPRRWPGVLGAAIGSQVILHWRPLGFHGLTALLAGVAVTPVVVSAFLQLPAGRRSLVRRAASALVGLAVLLCVPVVVAGILVEGKVSAGEQAAQDALRAVSEGSGGAAGRDLTTATRDLAGAADDIDAWWTAGAGLVPVASQQRRALAEVSVAARDLARVGAGQVRELDYERLGYHDGRVDLANVTAMEAPATTVDAAIRSTQRRVQAATSPWLVSPIGARIAKLQSELSRARSSTDLAMQAIKVLPDMLGANGTRHYFVAFMTPSEARGLDGFIGAYGELTADGGALSLTDSGSIYNLFDWGVPPQQRVLTGPSDFLAEWGQYEPAQYFQNATFSPDFPTVGDVISQLYRQSDGPPVDGVLALDPYAAAALLKITGPVHIPGLPTVTAGNAARLLLLDQYTIYGANPSAESTTRHDFLQDVLHASFSNLVHGSLPGPKKLADDLHGPVEAGRILFWSPRASVEALSSRIGLAGSFPKAGSGDLLSVTVQNGSANKIDALLHQSVDDQVSFDPANGATHDRITVQLRNDAPASGLPPYVIGEPDQTIPSGTNRAIVTVYSPLYLEGASVNGSPMTWSAGRELGVFAYRATVLVPPKSTSTLVLQLAGSLAARESLPVHVRIQPAANPGPVSVTIDPVPGWRVVGPSTITSGGSVVEDTVFRFR
ncbi:MAG TPA: DUF4012 domain-containing protein [Acidimicrobiales bacterium]|nr:DUF4012 domain-containing protein [Acidimicrobiales bacterium]